MGENGVETIFILLRNLEKSIKEETEKIQAAQTRIQEMSMGIASIVSIYLDMEKVPRKKFLVNPGDKPPCVHDPNEWEIAPTQEQEEVECYIVCGLNQLPQNWEICPKVLFQNGGIVFKFDGPTRATIPEAWYNNIGIFKSPAGVIQHICNNKVFLAQFYKNKK